MPEAYNLDGCQTEVHQRDNVWVHSDARVVDHVGPGRCYSLDGSPESVQLYLSVDHVVVLDYVVENRQGGRPDRDSKSDASTKWPFAWDLSMAKNSTNWPGNAQ